MKRETYDALIRCYDDAREGFAIIKDGIVFYINKALYDMAGQDICGKRSEELFDPKLRQEYRSILDNGKSISAEGVELFGSCLDVRAFKLKHMTAVVFTDLDAAEQELRKNRESFKLIKSAYGKLSDSITVVDAAAELMVKSLAADMPDIVKAWLRNVNDAVISMNTALLDMIDVIETYEKNENKGCVLGDLTAYVNQVAELSARQFSVRGARIEIKSEPESVVFPFNSKSVGNMILRLLADDADICEPGDVVVLNLRKGDGFAEIELRSRSGAPDEEYIRFLENPTDNMDEMLSRYGKNLYLVRRLAIHYDGTMKLERDGSGKVVTVRLPQVQIAPSVQQELTPIGRDKTANWWEMI